MMRKNDWSSVRLGPLLLVMGVLLSACGAIRPDPPLQVTLVAEGEPVLAILDNCPALRDVSLRDGDGVVWEITRRSPAPNAAQVEMRIGGSPNGWETITPLANPILGSTNYTLRTSPGGNELEFRVEDLMVGEAFTTNGTRDFTRADASQGCNSDVAWGDLWRQGAVFFILGILALLLVGTVVVKILSVFVPPRTDAYFADDSHDSYDDYDTLDPYDDDDGGGWAYQNEDGSWEYEDDGWDDRPFP